MQNEPLAIINSITAAVSAVLSAVVAFGLPVTDTQQNAIIAALAAVGVVVSTILARNRVFAPSTVEEIAANVAAGRDAGLLGE